MTSLPSFRYPLRCFRAQAENKLRQLSLARLEDGCAEDREYALLLHTFLRAISGPFLPWSIPQLRRYEHYLAQRGNFYFCPDEETDEHGTPFHPVSRDIYLDPYRDRY